MMVTTSRLPAKDNKPVAAVAVVAVTDPVEVMASAVVTEAVVAMAKAVAVVVVAEAAAEAVRRVVIAQEPLVLRARVLAKAPKISTPKSPRREELSAEKAEITAALVDLDLVTRSTDMSARLVKNSIHSTASPERELERRIRRRAATERVTGALPRMM